MTPISSKNKDLPQIAWILQPNQVTPLIIDFLDLIRLRLKQVVDICFLVPDHHPDILKNTEKLNPLPFQTAVASKENSLEGFRLKRDLLGDAPFSDGLLFWRTLLLDDLGSGNLLRTHVHLPPDKNFAAIFFQIPTPLGSSEMEERIFYALLLHSRQHHIPAIGYELLPLDTRWTLIPSMLDGIITLTKDSYDCLTHPRAALKNRIWLLPEHESRYFSPTASHFWRNALGCAYHHQNTLKLPPERTVLYIPHNVAMNHEYRDLVSHLLPFAGRLHLMFSVGKDQVRGLYSHQEIIELISRDTLDQFASYSFHDMNAPYEMTMADAVVACSACYITGISTLNCIPTIIFDETIPPGSRGFKKTICIPSDLHDEIRAIIDNHEKITELGRIILEVLHARQKDRQP
jgi:hypothetical protein